MRIISSTVGLLLILLISCSNTNTPAGKDKKKKKEKTYFVMVETTFGQMKLKLYNETPLHRDNFLKLVKEEFYDSLLFHRVIKDFMVQGGDPGSKNAPAGKQLGNGGPGYKIDAEIIPSLCHKKGALSAARKGDQQNPKKQSSGSQFYIVQGKTYTQAQLNGMEEKVNFPKKRKLVFDYVKRPENIEIKQRIDSLQKIRASKEINQAYGKVAELVEEEYQKLDLFKYSPEQIEAYTTVGGTPHLDQEYTVFGEVIEGLNIIDSLASVKVDRNNRPFDDIIMHMKIVRK